ncbi:hypothetical protein CVP05_11195 [Conservatibacter flavescens]|uniref:Uncharacterized protein n=1 Tax=Conservatibacter flavescens TaxID=28161 RepID=A0A2M8RZY9_9PAST|nr:hypothetical protein CVP05_11195 [Conservatibacter flavescens]
MKYLLFIVAWVILFIYITFSQNARMLIVKKYRSEFLDHSFSFLGEDIAIQKDNKFFSSKVRVDIKKNIHVFFL